MKYSGHSGTTRVFKAIAIFVSYCLASYVTCGRQKDLNIGNKELNEELLELAVKRQHICAIVQCMMLDYKNRLSQCRVGHEFNILCTELICYPCMETELRADH